MNLELLNELMGQKQPKQHLPEWLMFLEVCEMYLKKHDIKNPIVVELGAGRNRQKKFHEQLLSAEHISIDNARRWCTPDIIGNTHDPKTMETLKKKLGGRPINILFIDASHFYEDVKKDFDLYSPLCSDIIAFHDIETERHTERREAGDPVGRLAEVWEFWDDLKIAAYAGKEEYRRFLFLSIFQHRSGRKKSQMGIGMIMKK